MKLEEAKKVYHELKNINKNVIVNIDTEFFLEFAETVLQELERYKRLAEMNLNDSEEFKENMCKHRCLLKTELDNSISKDVIIEKLEDYKERMRYYKDEGIELDIQYDYYEERVKILEEILKEE